MAVLTESELLLARRHAARNLAVIAYTKPQIHAALQAIEDAMMTTPIPVGAVGATIAAYLANRIDAATTPFVFTGAQKKQIFAYWAAIRFEGDK